MPLDSAPEVVSSFPTPLTSYPPASPDGLFATLSDRVAADPFNLILTIGPLLGSFITEPAAMTICALLLGRQFFDCQPSARLRYATLGLLFVNVSIGGTLTHFAAPPVLMVARPWGGIRPTC